MKIEGETVFFKTRPPYFEKEKKGTKPNTARRLYSMEYEQICPIIDKIKKIQIESTETYETFERHLTDVSLAIHTEEYIIVIFSWIHEEEKETPE